MFYTFFKPHLLYLISKFFFYSCFIFSVLATAIAAETELKVPLTFQEEYKDLSTLPRIALIIGNSNYRHGVLENAKNDAEDFAKSLLGLGFKKENIILGIDLNKKHTRHMLRQFSNQLNKSASVGVFFYAGHGAQYQNEDYIIPINAEINTEDEINDEAIRVEDILEKMEEQGTDRLNIVILDACRNNPFPRNFKRSLGGTGLAGVEAPVGSLIAYATGKGMVASDGDGRNGLFTKHLLFNMRKPGLSLAEIFSRTRTGVMRESNNKQRPWEQTATTGNFFFTKSKFDNLVPLQTAYIEPTQKIILASTTDPTPKLIRSVQDEWTEPTTNMEFVWVANDPDCFMMGSPADESGRDFDEKIHRVCLENGFWMEKHEVTQAQWSIIMKNRLRARPSENTSVFHDTNNFPVENVSFNDIQQFINILNSQGDEKFRLPTEAEWEYAVRAGTTTPYYSGNCISDSQANSSSEFEYNYCGGKGGNPIEGTISVGSYEPNPFGLYDMSGNVWEWTCSSYDKNYTGQEERCANPNENSFRVIRGGGWNYAEKYLRSAARFRYNLNQRDPSVGFRLVRIK